MGDDSNRRTHDIALEDYEWAKKIDPIVDNAFSASKNKDYNSTIKYFKEALELAPGCDLFLMSIGSAYAYLDQKEKAIKYLERAAEINPGSRRIIENLNSVKRS